MKKLSMIILLTLSTLGALAFETYTTIKIPSHKHNEMSYQIAWCKKHNGIIEYENPDKTRVDCLTELYAVEFDFYNKWAESIGQALYYGFMTGKRPKVVLILENQKWQMVYYNRILKLSEIYDFDVEYVTNEILNLDENGKCFNKECKCYKNDYSQQDK